MGQVHHLRGSARFRLRPAPRPEDEPVRHRRVLPRQLLGARCSRTLRVWEGLPGLLLHCRRGCGRSSPPGAHSVRGLHRPYSGLGRLQGPVGRQGDPHRDGRTVQLRGRADVREAVLRGAHGLPQDGARHHRHVGRDAALLLLHAAWHEPVRAGGRRHLQRRHRDEEAERWPGWYLRQLQLRRRRRRLRRPRAPRPRDAAHGHDALQLGPRAARDPDQDAQGRRHPPGLLSRAQGQGRRVLPGHGRGQGGLLHLRHLRRRHDRRRQGRGDGGPREPGGRRRHGRQGGALLGGGFRLRQFGGSCSERASQALEAARRLLTCTSSAEHAPARP
mmetsp:Transcript_63562/g.160857  ORF Transcript_63562/g.160857 Transcript_63562/m.160857 type:complete len:331 (-) Transcript_63562:33-1025(-)